MGHSNQLKHGVSDKTPHRWHIPSGMVWATHCWRCGLMPLKNAATYRAIKAGCLREETIMDMTDENGNFLR